MSAKKDKERARAGKPHRSEPVKPKPPPKETCAIPHCSKLVSAFLADKGLPVCPMHGDMILTIRHVWFLLPGLADTAVDAPRPDKAAGGLVVVRNKGQEDAALKDIGRKMTGRG